MSVKIRERDGKWWLLVDWKGRRKAKCVGSKTAAEKAKIMLEARLTLGADVVFDDAKEREKPVLFGDYFRGWLETSAKLTCKQSTWKSYSRDFRLYLEPALGSMPLGEITRESVRRLLHTLLTEERELPKLEPSAEGGKTKPSRAPLFAKGAARRTRLSRGTVKNVLAALRVSLQQAVEDGKLPGNPAARLGRLLRSKDEPSQERGDFLTASELSALLAACLEHRPQRFPLVLTLARTGLRIGEAVALRWGDVDFHGRFIRIEQNFTGGRLTTPKSKKSRRSVDMSAGLAEILQREFVKAKERALAGGHDLSPDDLVFTDPGKRLPSHPGSPVLRAPGGRVDGDNFRARDWKRLLEKAGLRHIRIHDLRHTFASLLIQNGESLTYVRDQLGHYSIQITVDTYGHLVPGGNRAAVDRLDDVSPPQRPQQSATPAQPNQPGDLSRESGGPATAETSEESEWRRVDSNHGPRDYETLALAT